MSVEATTMFTTMGTPRVVAPDDIQDWATGPNKNTLDVLQMITDMKPGEGVYYLPVLNTWIVLPPVQP